jgi:serine/threonine-protein kinase
MISKKIGRYEVKSEIGRGGMATVFSAYDPGFRRDVAIKVLPPHFQHDPQFRIRFEREAQMIAGLEHQAIVPVYDFGTEGDYLFLVMRLMTGGSLADRIEKGPLTVDEAGRVFSHLAPGLDAAHRKGIIHRDLKPGNVLFDEWHEPYLSDFGIAKLVESSATALTAAGGLVGTPAYMSPEQVVAIGDLDGRSDIYAMGAILFEMLTGEQPYEANTPMGLAFKHVNEPVPRILDKNPDLPIGAQAIIDKAMAKDPNERYKNAQELAEAVAVLGQQYVTLTEPQPDETKPAEDEETDSRKAPIAAEAEITPVTEISSEEDEPPFDGVESTQLDRVEPVAIEPPRPESKMRPDAIPAVPEPPGAITTTTPARGNKLKKAKPFLIITAAILLIVICIGLSYLGMRYLISDNLLTEEAPDTAPSGSNGVVGSFINDKWAEGFGMTTVAYGGGKWLSVMTEDADDNHQTYLRRPDFPIEFVQQKWGEGFDVTDLAFGERKWLVVLTEGSGSQRQVIWSQTDFPSDFVEEKWNEGFDLTSVAYGGGQWWVIMTQSDKDLRQTMWQTKDFPDDFIRQKWDEGFYLTSATFGEGKWLVVMTEDDQDRRQTMWLTKDFPDEFVLEKWSQGFDLTTAAYGDGKWLVLLTASDEDSRQSYQLGEW